MVQDTVFVALPQALPQGPLESATLWILVGLAVLLFAAVVVLAAVLGELRKLSRGWDKFVVEATGDAQPLLRHAASAARNLDRAADAIRAEVVRATGALGGIAGGLDDAGVHLRKRLAELTALMDLIQSEAEEAVLDAAAKLRMLRRGAGFLGMGRREEPEVLGEEDAERAALEGEAASGDGGQAASGQK